MYSHRLTSVLAVTLAVTLGCTRRPAGPVSILLISVDTLRADRLNCYGYTQRRTSPAIDALARDGILFERSIATSPWTLPSHASLLTSLSPTHHGAVASFADFMAAPRDKRLLPRLSEEHWTLAEALAGAGYETAAFTGGGTLDPQLGFDQGFALYDTSMFKLSRRRMGPLVDWIGAHGTHSFFLFWHTFEVHAPYVATEFLSEGSPRDGTTILERRLDRRAARLRLDRDAFSNLDLKRMLAALDAYNVEVCSALYDGGVRSFDRYLERLVGALRSDGLYDRMAIVLTSDHGEEFDERGNGFYNKHGHTLYEELLHVPLIIKLPGQAHAGTRVKSVVSALDVMPTLLELAGVPAAPHRLEGVSLRPLWEGREAQAGRLVISEAVATGPERQSIQSDREKLILTFDPAGTSAQGRAGLDRQLFDLSLDPGEHNNLLGAGRPADAVARRAALLEEALRQERAAGKTQHAEPATIDPQTHERLRSLGYVFNAR